MRFKSFLYLSDFSVVISAASVTYITRYWIRMILPTLVAQLRTTGQARNYKKYYGILTVVQNFRLKRLEHITQLGFCGGEARKPFQYYHCSQTPS